MPVEAFILLFCVKYPISPLSTCKQFKYVVGIMCTIENIGAILVHPHVQGISYIILIVNNYLSIILIVMMAFILSYLYCSNYFNGIDISIIVPMKQILSFFQII